MKKYILSLLATGLIFTAYSQSAPGKWMIKKVGISLGQDMDMIQNMDAEFMINSGKGTESSVFRDANFDPRFLEGGFCENPHIRAMVTLGLPGEDRFNVDMGVNAIFNRWDGLYYSNNNQIEGSEFAGFENLNISSMSNEVNFELTLNRQISIERWLTLYSGLGMNSGYAFGGELYLRGATQETMDQNLNRSVGQVWSNFNTSDRHYETYQQRDAFTQRAYATAGIGITFLRRLELGVHLTRGVGYRKHFGSGVKMVNLHSGAFRANWRLGKTKRCCIPKW